MKRITGLFNKNDWLEKKICRIMAGFICVAAVGLLTACQSNAGIGSAEEDSSETGLNAGMESTGDTQGENSQASSDYSYEVLEDGTLRLTAYQPGSPVPEGATLEVPSEIVGKKVTVIGEECFADEEAFERGDFRIISLPEGITTIEDHILNRQIRKIEIPDSVTEIAEEAFFWLQTFYNYETQEDGTLLQTSYRESEWHELDAIIICCVRGSSAEDYARDGKMRYIYTDDNWRKDEPFLEQQVFRNYEYQYFEQYRVDGTYADFCVIEYYDSGEPGRRSCRWVFDIAVLDKESGEELQRIPVVDNYEGDWTSREIRIIEEGDADFDGKPELLVYRGKFGNQAARSYFCYHWVEAECRYIEYEDFRGIENPHIDEEAQVVRGSSRGGASTHYEYAYVFRNGEFILVEEKVRESTKEGNEAKVMVETYQVTDEKRTLTERTLFTYEVTDDGWTLIKEEQQPLD